MKIFCIIGDERAFQSKSPVMFSSIFKRVGIKAAYVPFKVMPAQIGKAMQSLRTLNIDGANIAAPYKESVIPHLDILSEGANIVGAINTIVRSGDSLKGYNTNAIGFMDTLEELKFEVAGKKALVIGSGGIAKAVVFIFNWLRAETIFIAARDLQSAESLTKNIAGRAISMDSLQGPMEADIIINATSVSSPDESNGMAMIAEKINVKGCEIVMDMNYGRRVNFWKEMAEARGIKFMDGLTILAHQARRCFSLWTRIDVEPAEFMKVLKEEV